MQAEIESRFGHPQIDLFVSSLSARKLSFLETRPTQQGDGCSATKLVSSIRTHPICFPSFSLYSKSLTQDRTEPSPYNDPCSANLSIIANNSQCSYWLSESATSLISSAKKAKFKLKLQFTQAKTG